MSYSVEEYRYAKNSAGEESWKKLGELLAVDKSMGADFTSPGIDVLYFDMGSISAVWSGADTTDATLTLQASLDNTNWCDMSGQSRTIDSAAANQVWCLEVFPMRFVRFKFTANTNTAGTLNARYLLKSRR